MEKVSKRRELLLQVNIVNFPCSESGDNCNGEKKMNAQFYVDPSTFATEVERRLRGNANA